MELNKKINPQKTEKSLRSYYICIVIFVLVLLIVGALNLLQFFADEKLTEIENDILEIENQIVRLKEDIDNEQYLECQQNILNKNRVYDEDSILLSYYIRDIFQVLNREKTGNVSNVALASFSYNQGQNINLNLMAVDWLTIQSIINNLNKIKILENTFISSISKRRYMDRIVFNLPINIDLR